MIARVGGTVRLNCTTSRSVFVEWKHGREFVFVNGAIDETLRSNHYIDKPVDGQYNLVITKVTAAEAGEYTCIDNAGSGEKLVIYKLNVTGNNKDISHCVMFYTFAMKFPLMMDF